MVLEQEVPPAAWQPLGRGYRDLEVECSDGGIAQRWLLVESVERAEMEQERLQHQMAKGEQAAQKALRRLAARVFACEADAWRALEEASTGLPFHRLVYRGVKEERQRGRVGRPRKQERPLSVGYRLLARVEVDEGKVESARRGLGRFLLATNAPQAVLPAEEVLRRYKDQSRTVERGFRFLKDPLFFAQSTFLKRPERVMSLGMVMAVALLVYALGEWELRQELLEPGQPTGSERQADPKAHPTLGVPAFHLGASGSAGGQAPGTQPGPPSRDRSPFVGGGAILSVGVRGVRNVGWRVWMS